jgi:hypothetical protein
VLIVVAMDQEAPLDPNGKRVPVARDMCPEWAAVSGRIWVADGDPQQPESTSVFRNLEL